MPRFVDPLTLVGSMMHTGIADSDTTVSSIASEQLASLTHTLPELPSLPSVAPTPLCRSTSSRGSSRTQPRCIHEVEEPSYLIDGGPDVSSATSVCHCATMDADEEDDLPPAAKTPLPFRYDGWIDQADENSELEFYYQRRSPPRAATVAPASRRSKSYSGLSALPPEPHASRETPPRIRSASGSRRIITPHNAPTTEYTLALLNERARLLDELAKIKGTPSVAT